MINEIKDMKRSVYHQLLEWKDSPRRKPLMLYGARRVGKTYILNMFGRNEFENMVYINCYKNPAVETLFSIDRDVRRILIGLSALSGQKITEGKTLIFIDDIQEIPDVMVSLRYFAEYVPGIFIVTAASLPGVWDMEEKQFTPVKVDVIHMYPMTFNEFVVAIGEKKMLSPLNGPDQKELINSLMPKYVELLRQYYFVGGMPEAVAEFIHSHTPEHVRQIQQDILATYDADIARHAGKEAKRARLVFQSIPSQLAKENKKFIFGALRKGSRASGYENAIQWLTDAGLVYKVPRLSKVEMPISSFMDKDAFKLFVLDVGLLGAMAQIPPSLMLIGNDVFSNYKGALSDNYVITQIMCVPSTAVGYYSKINSTMEIDFIVQAGNLLLPVEVKAEENVKSKSLRQFITVDKAGSNMKGIRFSMKGFEMRDWMLNLPLFAANSFFSAT